MNVDTYAPFLVAEKRTGDFSSGKKMHRNQPSMAGFFNLFAGYPQQLDTEKHTLGGQMQS